MPEPIGSQHFKIFCKSLNGQTLHTSSHKVPFTLEVSTSPKFSIQVTPQSTGKGRPLSEVTIDAYLNQYALTRGSLQPVDYQGGFVNSPRNASYAVTLFSLYVDHLPKCQCDPRP